VRGAQREIIRQSLIRQSLIRPARVRAVQHLVVVAGAAIRLDQQAPDVIENRGGKLTLFAGLELPRRSWHDLLPLLAGSHHRSCRNNLLNISNLREAGAQVRG